MATPSSRALLAAQDFGKSFWLNDTQVWRQVAKARGFKYRGVLKTQQASLPRYEKISIGFNRQIEKVVVLCMERKGKTPGNMIEPVGIFPCLLKYGVHSCGCEQREP